MLLKIVSVAVFAAVMGPIVATAQTVAQIGQPAERPPASFKGAQYVDSRGCVFMNASYGGAPRNGWRGSTAAHKVLCGYPPTFGPKPAIEVAEDVPRQAQRRLLWPQPPVVVKPAARPMRRWRRWPVR